MISLIWYIIDYKRGQMNKNNVEKDIRILNFCHLLHKYCL